ncbi:hypothetical protein [Rivularia sp. PCC 7116]|uniref:hypothetical protein n=1 Tax=Rivularia sp. PCC 7116 TaxID=373994 RepID=UPI000302B656|nr:hypothetical protein [Rivularia sp. PCC 7116]
MVQKRKKLRKFFSKCIWEVVTVDLMAGAVKGKYASEALLMVENFREMVIGETTLKPPLEKLNIMQSVAQFPMRVKCVTLAWHTLNSALVVDKEM